MPRITGQVVKDASRMARIWDEVKASSDFDARLNAVRNFNAVHPPHKARHRNYAG